MPIPIPCLDLAPEHRPPNPTCRLGSALLALGLSFAFLFGSRIRENSVAANRNLTTSATSRVAASRGMTTTSRADPSAQDRARGKPNRQKRQSKVPGAEVQPRATFAKFPDWVACVAYSPDSATLAAGS